ncbi:MAG: hypothetical protein IIZ59_03915 [Clostridia bacterium]|nr:hypothetical protein [Clostridia bacterium]
MMDKSDFEALVFEKADAIKKRDRRNKIIRLSVIPAAAAFAVISLVGVRSLFYMPQSAGTSLSDATANAPAAEYSAKNTAPEDMNDYGGFTNEYEAEDGAADNYDIIDNNGIEKNTQPVQTFPANETTSPLVSFDTNTRFFLYDDDAKIIAAALDREFTSDDFSESGFLCTVTVDDISYSIYETHVKAEKSGEIIGQYPLDDETKETLQNILPIRFGSMR